MDDQWSDWAAELNKSIGEHIDALKEEVQMPVDYSKPDAVTFGQALGDLIVAVRKDGVDSGDLNQLVGAVAAAAAIVNEIKNVPEAAVEHIIAAALDKIGDHVLQEASGLETGGF